MRMNVPDRGFLFVLMSLLFAAHIGPGAVRPAPHLRHQLPAATVQTADMTDPGLH